MVRFSVCLLYTSIAKIEELKEKVGIKKTIADYGIDEKYFLETLDDMCEKAFDDQCTGANPRYPLISEIKDMFLREMCIRDRVSVLQTLYSSFGQVWLHHSRQPGRNDGSHLILQLLRSYLHGTRCV